jgi:hypothetical protein
MLSKGWNTGDNAGRVQRVFYGAKRPILSDTNSPVPVSKTNGNEISSALCFLIKQFRDQVSQICSPQKDENGCASVPNTKYAERMEVERMSGSQS